ncbi:MAG: hypothetical protein QW117_03215 [Candidatus Pacearchaeota archaeon]
MQKNLFEKKYKEEKCLWGLKPDKYIIEILDVGDGNAGERNR